MNKEKIIKYYQIEEHRIGRPLTKNEAFELFTIIIANEKTDWRKTVSPELYHGIALIIMFAVWPFMFHWAQQLITFLTTNNIIIK